MRECVCERESERVCCVCERERITERRTFVFNNAHNTFYLRLYGVGHMVTGERERERERAEKRKFFVNDAHNTFYLWLYGVGFMVKDHSDSERGNPLPPQGYSFQLPARVLLYAPSHRPVDDAWAQYFFFYT